MFNWRLQTVPRCVHAKHFVTTKTVKPSRWILNLKTNITEFAVLCASNASTCLSLRDLTYLLFIWEFSRRVVHRRRRTPTLQPELWKNNSSPIRRHIDFAHRRENRARILLGIASIHAFQLFCVCEVLLLLFRQINLSKL